MKYAINSGEIKDDEVVTIIRASVDTLCRDETGQFSCDLPTKRLLTQLEHLASL